MLILPVNGCTWTEMKDTWIPPHLCKHLDTNAHWEGREGPKPNPKGPGQAAQLYLLEAAEMQRVVVNKEKGKVEMCQQQKKGDQLLGRAAKGLCSNVGENTGLFRAEYEMRQSSEDSRTSWTSPFPLLYLGPLSTASLSAEAARLVFKVQWATWMVTIFHEMEFTPPASLRGLGSTCDCKALWPYAVLPTTTLLCAQAEQPISWTANLEEKIQVYSVTEKKFIIRKETVPPSFQKPEQGWKVLAENDKSV